MSASVLFNLLNDLGNKLNKFNNTGAQIVDSILSRTLKLLKNGRSFILKSVKMLPYSMQRYNGRH